ncbi:hypothetical protein ACVWZV_000993 [Bradyrhizobium sp. GM5.1]
MRGVEVADAVLAGGGGGFRSVGVADDVVSGARRDEVRAAAAGDGGADGAGDGDEVGEGAAVDVLDAVDGDAGEADEIQGVVPGAEIDDAAAGVDHGQDVVGRCAVDVLDPVGGDRVGSGGQVQGVVALLQVDDQARGIVQQRQGVVRGRHGAAEDVGRADARDVGQGQRIGAGGDLQAGISGAEIDGQPILVVGQGVERVGLSGDDQVFDVVEREAAVLRSDGKRVVADAKVDRHVVVRRVDAVRHRQDVVRGGAVDAVDVEEVGERVRAGGEIEGVDAVAEVDREAADVAQKRERVIGDAAGGKVAAGEDFVADDAQRVDAVGQHHIVVATAHVHGQAVDVGEEADEVVASGAHQMLDVGQVEVVAAGDAEHDGVVGSGAEVDQMTRKRLADLDVVVVRARRRRQGIRLGVEEQPVVYRSTGLACVPEPTRTLALLNCRTSTLVSVSVPSRPTTLSVTVVTPAVVEMLYWARAPE